MPAAAYLHLLHARQTSAVANPADVLNGATKLATWDGCMAKSYCKWPVIIGIIIACVFAFSILWCLVRCACLGKDFACCCFRCLSCCCGPKRTPEGIKYDNVGSTPPTRGAQYTSHAKMQYGGDPFGQTAVFEGPVHADSLPTMPSWDTAASRKIEVIEKAPESVEMEPLKESQTPSARGGTPTPRPTGMSRSQSGYDDMPISPGMRPSRTNSGVDGMHSPLRNNAQQPNGGYSAMPSPMQPTLPNMYGSGNRTPRAAASPVYGDNQYNSGIRSPRAAASPVYGNDQYGNNRSAASGRNTPQSSAYSAGGYNGRTTPRSPYGAPTNSSYSNTVGYGPSSVSSYSTANNGYGAGDYMSPGGSQHNSGRGIDYGNDNAYGQNNAAGYSAYDGNSSPYKQTQRRPVPGQQQGSYMS